MLPQQPLEGLFGQVARALETGDKRREIVGAVRCVFDEVLEVLCEQVWTTAPELPVQAELVVFAMKRRLGPHTREIGMQDELL